MTTPAHCTRTWRTAGDCPVAEYGRHHCSALDSYHHVQHVCECGNVEPPADVQATPDPRVDVVERVLATDDVFAKDTAQCILDALDAMRPEEHRLGDLVGAEPNLTGGLEPGEYLRRQYAPAGLTPAQEIRLRLYETGNWTDGHTIDEWSAWVEHGDDHDETSEHPHDYPAGFADGRRVSQIEIAALVARAGLAEARLGQVADIVKDRYGMAPGDFADAVRDALAWTPDDTATADADTTGDGDGD